MTKIGPPHSQGPVQATGNGECGSTPWADVMLCALRQLWAPLAVAPESHLLHWGKAALVPVSRVALNLSLNGPWPCREPTEAITF